METTQAVQHINIIRHLIPEDGNIPNNPLIPLLIYQKVILLPQENPGQYVIELFEENGWENAWEDSIHDFHHYHSITHEVLGVIKGSARVQFGGSSGVVILIETGDVVVIPAGVAHKAIDIYDEFKCIGAYPAGYNYDMNYGREEELRKAIENIKAVHIPPTDPVYGIEGPLVTNWKI